MSCISILDDGRFFSVYTFKLDNLRGYLISLRVFCLYVITKMAFFEWFSRQCATTLIVNLTV